MSSSSRAPQYKVTPGVTGIIYDLPWPAAIVFSTIIFSIALFLLIIPATTTGNRTIPPYSRLEWENGHVSYSNSVDQPYKIIGANGYINTLSCNPLSSKTVTCLGPIGTQPQSFSSHLRFGFSRMKGVYTSSNIVFEVMDGQRELVSYASREHDVEQDISFLTGPFVRTCYLAGAALLSFPIILGLVGKAKHNRP